MNGKQKLDEFINKVDSETWKILSFEEKLALLQDLEDIMAEIEGRPAYKVTVMSQEEADQGICGYFSFQDNKFCISPYYFETSLDEVYSQYTFPDALNTIIHEGRHAWQHYVMDHPELNLVDEKDRLAIKMNQPGIGVYFDYDILYDSQLVELDARRFALEIMTYINDGLTQKLGKEDELFAQEIINEQEYEIFVALQLLYNCSEKDFDKLDADIKEYLEQITGMDYSGISIFESAEELVKTADIDAFLEEPVIRTNGPKWFEKEMDSKEKIDDEKVKIDKPKIRFI